MGFQIHRLTFCIPIALVVLVLFIAIPVSADMFNGYYRVAPGIEQGATVFIGEQGLDITNALNSANLKPLESPTTAYTTIGWWASAADIYSKAPDVSVDLTGRAAQFTVTQAEFDGYAGQWYLVDSNANNIAKRYSGAVFNVKAPKLDVSIRDVEQNDGADVSGKSIPQGSKLQFQIGTNMYTVLDPSLRYTVYGNTGSGVNSDGYLDIIVKDETGAVLQTLYSTVPGVSNTIVALNVSTQPYTWGRDNSGRGPGIDYVWSTAGYPVGTYTVSVQSKLNNMKNNYLAGAAAYTGRTVSETKTITLFPEIVSITANKDSVVRTYPFSITITGAPNTWYNVWIRNTSNLNIVTPNGAPPIITKFQESVLEGNFSTYSYFYQNGGGTLTVGDNAYGESGIWFQNPNYVYSYAYAKTSTTGTRTVEFSTTTNTKAQKFTIRVERNTNDNNYFSGVFKGDEVDVNVETVLSVSKIAVYRNGVWIIDNNDNFAWNGAVSDKLISFDNHPISSGDRGVTGDWNGDTKLEVGIFDGAGNWYLDYNGNGVYDGTVFDRKGTFGSSGFTPIVGDWDGTGKDKIGVEKDGIWAIDYNGNYIWDGDGPDRFAAFGQTGDIPVIGDWDGSGKDKIGSHKEGFWAVDYNGNYQWDGAVTDRFAGFGQTGDTPVIGDWNGDGKDKIGIEINGFWATDYNGNYLWEGAVTDRFAGFGSTGDTPFVGDWDGTGKAKIGSFKDGFWAIDYNGNHLWDGAVTDRFAGFGQTGDVPVVGKWS